MTREQRQLEASEDLRWLMSTERGRRLAWALIDERCGAVGISFAGEATHETAYREGRRSIGVALLAECQRLAPSDSVQMLQEAVSRRAEDELTRERSNAGSDAADDDAGR